jgi:parallel beta-helix repeat protein
MKNNDSTQSEKTNLRWFLAVTAGLPLAALLVPRLRAQGGLTPPGPPAPTMKTLDQIASTGVAINDTNTPGDANYHYIISTPGSYYLRANLSVTKPSGIHVTAPGVTVDLNGFQISRGSGTGGDGIRIDMTAHRCTIKNGGVAGFANGVFCFASGGAAAHGGSFLQVSASGCSDTGIRSGDSWQLEGCQAHDNLNTGISTGFGCTLSHCTAYGNQVFIGIVAGWACTLNNCDAYNNQVVYPLFAGYGSTLINCSAHGNHVPSGTGAITVQEGSTLNNCAAFSNQATWGIYAAAGSTLTNCSAYSNTGADPTSAGIHVADGCTMIGCAASSNTSTNGTLGITTGMGIDADSGVTIKDCTTRSNVADGIRVASNCLVTGCTSSSNGLASGFGDGIRTSGDNNRLDGNHVVGNSLYGIRSSSTNFVIRNTASGNGTANYNPSSGVNFGPLQTVQTATSPWANF